MGFTTAAALLHELMEARDEKRLLRFQKQLAKYSLLVIDELGFVPLSKTGAELQFEVFSQRYERGATLVTSNLPFDEWTEIFGSERLTGALLDRLTHHVHILEMNGESYRLNQSQKRRKSGGSQCLTVNAKVPFQKWAQRSAFHAEFATRSAGAAVAKQRCSAGAMAGGVFLPAMRRHAPLRDRRAKTLPVLRRPLDRHQVSA